MTKEMSKRQQRREKIRRQEQRSRLFMIGGVTLVAIALAALFILPNLRPVGEIATAAPREYPQPDGLALGDPNAAVKIDVFEDFQCPACRSFTSDTEPRIVETYVKTGQVYYVFHHYPFLDTNSSTKESQQSANASMCASEQGKFWEYHDILYANWNGENLGAFNDRRLRAFAEKIDGMDTGAFNDCFEENRYEENIAADFALGDQMGVSGTPSVFVNGQPAGQPGTIPQWNEVQQAVEAALSGQ